MAETQMNKQEFIQKIKAKYPVYNNIDDDVLYDKMITKYPVYKSQIKEDTSFGQGVLKKTKEAFVGGGKKILEGAEGITSGKYNIPEGMMRGIAGTFQSALAPVSGIIGQTAETGFKALPEDTQAGIIKGVTPIVQGAKDYYAKQSPEQQRRLSNIGVGADVLSNFVGAKGVQLGGKEILKSAESGFIKDVGEGIVNTSKTVVDTSKVGLNKLGGVKDAGQALLQTKVQEISSGLTKPQIKGYQANPYQAKEFEGLKTRIDSPEGLDDVKNYKTERIGEVTKELTDTVDTLKASKGEISPVYNEIRKQTNPIPAQGIITDFENVLTSKGLGIKDGQVIRLPGIKAGELNQADVSKLNQLYTDLIFDVNKQSGNLTPSQILDLRKTASDLSKYDAASSTTGLGIMRSIRGQIDKNAKKDIVGLKEIDAQYVDKLEELDNALRDLVYKAGDAKGDWRSNIVSIVSNLDKTNRAKLLARLEDVMPGIGDKIEAINNLPSIYKGMQDKGIFSKISGTSGMIGGALALGSTVPVLGHIVGGILGGIAGKAVETGINAFKTKAIENILSKISKEGQDRLKAIDTKIATKQAVTSEEQTIISNIRKQIQDEAARLQTQPTKQPLGLPSPGQTTNQPLITPLSDKNIIDMSKKGLEKTVIGKPNIIKAEKKSPVITPRKIENKSIITKPDKLQPNKITPVNKSPITPKKIESSKSVTKGGKEKQMKNDKIRAEGKTEQGTIIPKEFKGKEVESMGTYLESKGYKKTTNGPTTIYTKGDVFVKVTKRDGESFMSVGKDRPLGSQTSETGHRYKDSLFNELEFLDTNITKSNIKDNKVLNTTKSVEDYQKAIKIKKDLTHTDTIDSIGKDTQIPRTEKIKEYEKILSQNPSKENIDKINKKLDYLSQSYFDERGWIQIEESGIYNKPSIDIFNKLPDIAKKEYLKRFSKPVEKKVLNTPKPKKAIDNKGGYIAPGQIFTDIKKIGSKILNSMQDPNIPKAKAMYEDLVKKGISPLDAQKQIVEKYGSNAWKGSKAASIGKSNKINGITDSDMDLIFEYTKSGGGEKVMSSSKQQQVSKALKKLPDNKEVVYSGQKMTLDQLDEIKYAKNDIWTNKRLISSSTDRNIAQSFADYNPKGKNKIILVFDGGGKDINTMSRYSGIKNEKEVLFPIGTKFRVTDLGDNTFKLSIIEEVNPTISKPKPIK